MRPQHKTFTDVLCFDSSETPPTSQMFKLKKNKDMEGLTPPPGNTLAGQKYVFQATEWNRQETSQECVPPTRLLGIVEKPS